MRQFGIVIEWGPRNYSAYAPDVPGCVATGRTLAEVRRNMREALAFHLESMERDGDPMPEPRSACELVEA